MSDRHPVILILDALERFQRSQAADARSLGENEMADRFLDRAAALSLAIECVRSAISDVTDHVLQRKLSEFAKR